MKSYNDIDVFLGRVASEIYDRVSKMQRDHNNGRLSYEDVQYEFSQMLKDLEKDSDELIEICSGIESKEDEERGL